MRVRWLWLLLNFFGKILCIRESRKKNHDIVTRFFLVDNEILLII